MASGNLIKPTDAKNSTFHVMSRGVDRMDIFRSRRDRLEFLDCFRRYLSPETFVDRNYRPYRKLHDEVAILAFCLMDNHFHMLVHQYSARGMRLLLHGALSGYGRYFNATHRRDGPVFKSRYRAEPVLTHDHAKMVGAYTHLNEPFAQLSHPFTSHRLYSGESSSDWIDVDAGLAIYGGYEAYLRFLNLAGPGIVARKIAKRGLDPKDHPFRPIQMP